MDDLDALIARLEKSTGLDRELANEVLWACGWSSIEVGPLDNPTYEWMAPDEATHYGHNEQPNPLESIDAAMQSVPEGYYLAEFGDCLTHWKARLAPREAHPTIPRGHMNHYCGFNDGMKPKTAPIALTIAALKARKQNNG